MTDLSILFQQKFKDLTGHPPLSWQTRLYRQHFANGDLDSWPAVIDIPTGLGKTMIMAIWLIARANKLDVPTRLVYVVDRRTVVDQATYLALKIRGNCQQALGIEPPAISTLRGQLADDQEWSRDPSRPAIIIGTVDLIGSALLFSGYRSSYKRRPLEAGLLGQDSLLVLDEAHLSKPFERLICAIGDDGSFQKTRKGNAQGKPMRVVRMSATSGNSADSKPPFTLQFDANGNLTGEDANDNTIAGRFGAKKRLTITTLGEKDKLVDKLASAAIELVAPSNPQHTPVIGQRIVIFTRRPDDARTIAETIRKSKKGDFAKAVEVLTGTMRGLERDELVEKPVFKKRWLNGDLKPDDPANQSPVFLIATSAGEVGFDLNADHMICDATTIDSLIQRLGRVNRRGLGDAQIHLFAEPPKKEKGGKPKKLEGLDKAIANTVDLLQGIENVSPKNIAALKASGAWTKKADNGRSAYENACSPLPTMVDLTDILLDAWSMTSITEPMPGRPEVGPWLRGIADELPQTMIAWRAELDFEGFADLNHDDIEEWFDTHRILTHETLTVKTSDAATWFTKRWEAIPEARQRALDKLPIVINRAGLEIIPLSEFIKRLSRKASDADAFLRGAEVIVPASFGGIRRGVGLLDPTEPKLDKEDEKKSPEERETILKARQNSIDVADVRGRYREKVEKPEDGEAVATPLDHETVKPRNSARHAIELSSDNDCTLRLISYVPKRERLDWGTQRQHLHDHDGRRGHVESVHHQANEIVERLGLQSNDPVRQALKLAVDWHDNGKDRERWQRCAGRQSDEPPLGKSGGEMKRDPRGYRHEFGSLREFTDASNAGTLLDGNETPISQNVFDLAMHLIAAHHGRGRPHFPRGGFDPDRESRSDEIHTESIRRFARLQRQYGWWHLTWLENLLRCADAMASADQDAKDDTADTKGGAA